MRKEVSPPTRMRTFLFSEKEFMQLLGIEGGCIVRVSCLIREVEIAMDLNADGTRDHYHLDEEEFRQKLGLPADYRPSSAFVQLTFPLCRRQIEIRAFPR